MNLDTNSSDTLHREQMVGRHLFLLCMGERFREKESVDQMVGRHLFSLCMGERFGEKESVDPSK